MSLLSSPRFAAEIGQLIIQLEHTRDTAIIEFSDENLYDANTHDFNPRTLEGGLVIQITYLLSTLRQLGY